MKVPAITKKILVPLAALTLSTATYSSSAKMQNSPKDSFEKELIPEEEQNKEERPYVLLFFMAAFVLGIKAYKAAIIQNIEDSYEDYLNNLNKKK